MAIKGNKGDFKTLDALAIRSGTIVNTGAATFGTATFTSTSYQSIYLGVNDLQTTAVASYALVNVSTQVTTVGALGVFLDGAASEIAAFSFSLPKDYKVGTSMLPYVNYSCTSSTGSTGIIILGLAYQEVNATPTTAAVNLATQQINVNGSTGILSIISTYFAAIGSTSLKAGSVIAGTLFRNSTNSTSVALDAVIYGLGFLYQVDSIGSTYNTILGK